MMKIKIQQLKKEDFFVTMSGKDLITDLKEKILAILKAAQVEEEDLSINITNLRLIYKGKVLLDPKSLEFYNIQSDDTIQLCPIRRSLRVEVPTDRVIGSSPDIDLKDEDDNVREQSGPITFYLGQHPELGGMRQLQGQSRIRNRRIPNGHNTLTQADSSGPSTGNRTTPEAFTDHLQNLRSALEDSLRQVNSVNMENREDLVPHLDTLIRQARNLRDDLATEQQEQPPASGVEILVFVRARATWDSDLEEKQDRVSESNTGDHDNAGLRSPLSARREGVQNSTISSPSSVAGGRERPNAIATSETAPPRQRRNSRSRNIFSNIINRFSRRG